MPLMRAVMPPTDSLQDTYARLLVHAEPERGYPLWFPEPSIQLPPKFLHGGVRIGDVGIVTAHGNFDVFFNICLPEFHPLHHRYGVPEGFKQIKLSEKDVEIIEDPNYRGCIVTAKCSPKKGVNVKVTGANPNVVAVKGSKSESTAKAAFLALPGGADKHDLRDTSIFQREAMRMGKKWYEFALNKLGRTTMSCDSLYLVTGYHKASTWTLAAFHNPAAIWNVDVRYTENGDVLVTDPWHRTSISPCPIGFDEKKNHTVTMRGFKIAITEKTFRSLLPSGKGKGLFSVIAPLLHHGPPTHKIYHPLDGINSILLGQAKHCDMVVTHDSMWKDIVKELPSDRSHVVAAIKKKGYVLSSHAGCAYLRKRGADGPVQSNCSGLALSIRVNRAVAKLAVRVKTQEKKRVDTNKEKKKEKATRRNVKRK